MTNSKGALASKRWRKLAKTKLPEVDELIARATAFRDLVQAGLHCTCGQVEMCIGSNGHACVPAGHVCVDGVDCGCEGH